MTACAVLPGPQLDREPSTHMELRYALTLLDEDEHAPAEEVSAAGIYFQRDWLEFGLFEGKESSTVSVDNMGTPTALNVWSELSEVSVGYRKTFREESGLRPFVGIGAAHIRGELSRIVGTDWVRGDESSFGAYGLVGVSLDAAPNITFDIGVRGLFGTRDFEFSGFESNLDYFQAYISVGSWF